MSVYNYPAPKAPEYEQPTSVEDCLPEARKAVKQTHGRAALGPLEEGEKALLVTLPDQDPYVRDALRQAVSEQDATADFIDIEDLTGQTLEKYTAEEGWREAKMFEEGRASTSQTNADLATGIVTDDLVEYLGKHPEYDSVHSDVGQRFQKRAELGDAFKGNWLFNNWEEFVSGVWTYPGDLLEFFERQAMAPLKNARAVRITDPEGTHLEYELTAQEARRWYEGAFLSGHLFFNPFQATVRDPAGPVIPKVDGTLAGTSNHTGYYPRIELHFSDGRLVGVDGGGKYGEKIEELMHEYADVQWPGYPEEGMFWFVDTALCTLPKAFRRTSDLFDSYWQYPNITERNRSGVFHMGFGSASVAHTDEQVSYAQEHDLPTGHIHVHNYFSTFEIQLANSNNWQKIVDKGRITAMDSPVVRAKAAEFGDPDQLLGHDWEPPLPGVNCAGDYSQDYAPDPAGYIKERMESEKPV